MATLVFSAVGTLVGGPLGGAIGALAGRQIDAAIIGSPNRQGPRLRELAVTTSSYGSILPRHFGRIRAPGSIIWATELVEHTQTQGGGKGRPSVTSYSYSASFAVALASRPIEGIGRIWADGNLLRGEAGDLKTGGAMRVHTGRGDQEPDPLIAEIEGPDRCPAYRGLAYVVFEDLELVDFHNRIPALTFEILAGDSFDLHSIVGEVIPDTDARLALDGLDGFSCEGPVADTLAQLAPMFPLDADAGGELLVIGRHRLQDTAILLSEPAVAVGDGDFGGASGFSRQRAPIRQSPPEILRYYDIDRDYLPGLQRTTGRAGTGQPRTLELPASMTAANARQLIENSARRSDWSRDRIAWRTSELSSAIAPGATVALPDKPGQWRIREWEWRDTGIELSLERIAPDEAGAAPAVEVDPGRINPPADLPAPPTALLAFELPWDGIGPDITSTFAAASSAGANWSGAALYVDRGDGQLEPLGPTGRTRSIIGSTVDILPPGSPTLLDRSSTVVVELLANDLELSDATLRHLAYGGNRALIGNEIVQFSRAVPLGDRRWRLETLLRGRGGTEASVHGHGAGEPFALIDGRPTLLDPARLAASSGDLIVAVGRGDVEPVTAPLALQGISSRPLSPVHPRATLLPEGSLSLAWTRRARGAWHWLDGADTPLHEQGERYLVTFGAIESPAAAWTVEQSYLEIDPGTLADLTTSMPLGTFAVRQQGDHGMSPPLYLHALTCTHKRNSLP